MNRTLNNSELPILTQGKLDSEGEGLSMGLHPREAGGSVSISEGRGSLGACKPPKT